MSRGKCSFWKLGFSLLVNVSWKMLILEAWILTFGESLVENARFGSLDSNFRWMSRGKRSFWKLGWSLLVNVSWKTLVLEAWSVTFGECLVEKARFGSLDCHFWWMSRGKCSFWKLGFSLLVKVSWKMLILEAWIVTFGECLVENARFGSLDCHFWWKSRGKRSFWKLGWSLWMKSRGVQQECQARVSRKSVKEECLGKSVKKECQAKVV